VIGTGGGFSRLGTFILSRISGAQREELVRGRRKTEWGYILASNYRYLCLGGKLVAELQAQGFATHRGDWLVCASMAAGSCMAYGVPSSLVGRTAPVEGYLAFYVPRDPYNSWHPCATKIVRSHIYEESLRLWQQKLSHRGRG